MATVAHVARQAEAKAATQSADAATEAITAEKYKQVPLTAEEKKNLQRGTTMYLDAQEGLNADHERAARIAHLKTDIATKLHEYETAPEHEHLLDPFHRERQGKVRIKAQQVKFKKVSSAGIWLQIVSGTCV